MSTRQSTWLALAPALFLTLWSTGYVAAKFGLTFAEPFTILTLRFGLIVMIMAAIFAFIRPPLPKTLADWGHVALVGFLIQAVYFGMCYMAFNAGIAVGTLALILSLQPVLIGLIAPRWVGEAIGWRRWIGLMLGLFGAGLVIVARSEIASPSLASFAFAVLGLLGITTGSLWEKRFGLSHHPVTSSLIGFAAGFLGMAPFMLALETMQINWTWAFAGTLAYLVVGTSILGVGLLLAMIRAGDVSRVSALFFLVPPFAAFVAWLALDEIMPPLAWGGMAVAAAGVFLATRQSTALAAAK